MNLGICSVSFRSLPPEEIIRLAADAGLGCVEWGSDVHAPCGDADNLHRIHEMQRQAGLFCSSYGTYFRVGEDAPEALRPYCEAAKTLGTDTLRIWCGSKNADGSTRAEKAALFEDCRRIAALAAEYAVTVCAECHGGTCTETLDGALELMRETASPHFRMYWQPNQLRTPEENLHYARSIAPYAVNLHVFQWKGAERFPLENGVSEWRGYLSCFSGIRTALLEFMPDDSPDSLPAEAAALREIVKGF